MSTPKRAQNLSPAQVESIPNRTDQALQARHDELMSPNRPDQAEPSLMASAAGTSSPFPKVEPCRSWTRTQGCKLKLQFCITGLTTGNLRCSEPPRQQSTSLQIFDFTKVPAQLKAFRTRTSASLNLRQPNRKRWNSQIVSCSCFT